MINYGCDIASAPAVGALVWKARFHWRVTKIITVGDNRVRVIGEAA